MSEGKEPQTWAQSIKAYQHGKTNLSWNPAEVPPPTYVKQFDVSRKSREMDPVLMRHRNPEVEAKRKSREEERVRVTLNNARTRQLRVEQNYDIVTHSSLLAGKQEPVARPTRHPDSRTSYDILNHVPRENARSVALIYADGESPGVIPQKVVTVEGGKKSHSHVRRDVDVLSNRFLEKHDERTAEERRYLQERSAEKFHLTHDYNPIVGAYYDHRKEQDFVCSREKLAALQGQAQQHRLPPSIRYGEGNDYDIINQKPKDVRGKGEAAAVADRGLSKRIRGRETHEQNVRKHESVAAVRDARTLNRPSHMRHVEVLRTGYDVISNRVFAGREGKPPPKPHAPPPVPVWDRLAGSGGAASGCRTGKTSAGEAGRGESTEDAGSGRRSRGRGDSSDRRDGKDSSGYSARGSEESNPAIVASSRRQEERGGRESSSDQQSVDTETRTAHPGKAAVPPLNLSGQLKLGGA